MRRRTITLQEPPRSSICAFCAHQLRALRQSKASHRFLQTSRPSAKPPTASTAALGEGSRIAAQNDQLIPTASQGSWSSLSTTAIMGDTAQKLRQPAFGSGIFTKPQTSSSGWIRPAFGSATVELTEEELRVKEHISHTEAKLMQRRVSIPSGLGPESTRSGRPIPVSATGKLSAADVRLRAIEWHATNARNRNQSRVRTVLSGELTKKSVSEELQPHTYFQLSRAPSGEEFQSAELSRVNHQNPHRASSSVEGSAWGQLKRKTSEPQQPANFDLENKSVLSQYTPLWKAPKPGTGPVVLKNNSNVTVGLSTTYAKSQPQRQDTAPNGRNRDKARRRESFVQDFGDDELEAENREFKIKKQRQKERAAKKLAKRAAEPIPLLLPEFISVGNLAAVLRVRIEDFMRKLDELGFEEMSNDHILNGENAGLIAMEYNFEPMVDKGESEDLKAQPRPEDTSQLPQRPPVVTIMGHVDHGKTTLLDWLRKSSVAATEHGGITQHIGAFSVSMPLGKLITFLDTPGHAAFLSMRQRGANVTDIIILVVAADDSVKPQTIEAIKHAKAAKVPIIVAINKVDKEESNIERVKHDLARHGVEIEDFGGDTQVVSVSGKTGQGMNELEESIVTLSEILDMRADRGGPAEGWVLEASIKSMGKVATVLVRRGTMRPGDFIVAGKTWARIRCLRNEAGAEVGKAGPGTAVEIDGWKEQPLAGDEVLQAPTEGKAKSIIEYRVEQEERDKMAKDMEVINKTRKFEHVKREREKQEALLTKESTVGSSAVPEEIEQANGPKQIYFIVKGDVSGSVEAVVESISSIGNGEVQPHVLRSGVGQVTEFDVEHTATAKGYLINFNTVIDPNISRLAESSKVMIIDHNIIYKLVDEVKETLSAYLPPLLTQRVLGEAEIAQAFDIKVKRQQYRAVAGCKVRNGVVSINDKVRVLRNGEKVFDGALASLKNVKKDVTEMRKGNECGMSFEGWSDFLVGDQVQSYETLEERRYL